MLGPLLFLVFINDVLEGIDCHAKLFAEDCILYTQVSNFQDQVNLNSWLKKAEEWCDEWQMTLNTEKTMCMTVTQKERPLLYSYVCNENMLERFGSYKYYDVRWDTRINNAVMKPKAKFYFLRRYLKHASQESKLQPYKKLIRSHLV